MKKVEKSIFAIISEEYHGYTLAALRRAIPNLISGHKEVHHAIFFSSYKTSDFRKVEGIGAQVVLDKDFTDYEHGANNASDAVVTVSQDYQNSSNNIPMFETKGSFGTLIEPEAAAPRYIQAKFNHKQLDKIFDYYLSEEFKEDNSKAPLMFVPLIPMCIINGISGMAPGYSCDIHPRNPKKVIQVIKSLIQNEDAEIDETLLYPEWNNQFPMTFLNHYDKLSTEGNLEHLGGLTYRITSIPPLISFQRFRENIENAKQNGYLTSYEDNSKLSPDVTVKLARGNKDEIWQIKLKLGLYKDVPNETITTLFDKRLYIFEKISDLVRFFVSKRLSFYDVKRAAIIRDSKVELERLKNQKAFIIDLLEFMKTERRLMNKKEMEEFKKKYSGVSVSIYQLTEETINDIDRKIEEENKLVEHYRTSTNEQLYLNELKVLEKELNK